VVTLTEVLSDEALKRPGSSNPLLSEAALKLVLEVQLLAAGVVQRQRKQCSRSSVEGLTKVVTGVLLHCNVLLLSMLHCMAEASGSGLPPELLQQAGLQLLQVLAAPLQQVQLCKPGDTLLAIAEEGNGALQYQLYALKVAAAGLLAGPPGGAREGEFAVLPH
jgi:hypothetical protein